MEIWTQRNGGFALRAMPDGSAVRFAFMRDGGKYHAAEIHADDTPTAVARKLRGLANFMDPAEPPAGE